MKARPPIAGPDYEKHRDARLVRDVEAARRILLDAARRGAWLTYEELAEALGAARKRKIGTASASARKRDLTKPADKGGVDWIIPKRRRPAANGRAWAWEYQVDLERSGLKVAVQGTLLT